MSSTNHVDRAEDSIKPNLQLNSKVLLLIVGLALAFEFYALTTEFDTSIFNVSDTFLFIGPIGAMTLGFIIALKNGKDSMYFKPFLALSFGVLFFMLGEATYLYYDIVLGEDPYPSIGDLFYWLFYPFVTGFIIYALKFFAFPLSKSKIAIISVITVGLTLIFFGYSYEVFEGEIYDFDFGLGMLFVASAALTVGLATLGIISFKRSLQGYVWLLLLSSLLINAIGDIWYYHLELFEAYEPLGTVDTLYIATWMVMFYGVFRHYRYST